MSAKKGTYIRILNNNVYLHFFISKFMNICESEFEQENVCLSIPLMATI